MESAVYAYSYIYTSKLEKIQGQTELLTLNRYFGQQKQVWIKQAKVYTSKNVFIQRINAPTTMWVSSQVETNITRLRLVGVLYGDMRWVLNCKIDMQQQYRLPL